MLKRIFSPLLLSSFILLSTYQSALSQEALTEPDVERIVREYLLKNPEIMLEMQQALEAKEKEILAISQKEALKTQTELVYSAPYQIEIGNPEAKTTIVEFFDYNCHFCQRAVTDMQLMLQGNSDLKFILKEFPVLGEGSIEASRVSMALSKLLPPEKHVEFHIELLSMHGQKDGNRAIELAVRMGANEEELKAEMENPQIIETIQNTYGLANSLGISGTPSYIVGEKVVFGAVGHDELDSQIKNLN